MATADSLKRVAQIVKSDEKRRCVVVSAPGKREASDEKVTDLLLRFAKEIENGRDFDDVLAKIKARFENIIQGLAVEFDLDGELTNMVKDVVDGAGEDYAASRGEYLSAKLFAIYIGAHFVDAKDVIKFSSGGAVDVKKTALKLRDMLDFDDRVIIPGFYAVWKAVK